MYCARKGKVDAILAYRRVPISHLADGDDGKNFKASDDASHTSSPSFSSSPTIEYLVKWEDRSHLHNSWEPERRLLETANRKLRNFLQKMGVSNSKQLSEKAVEGGKCENSMNEAVREEWLKVDRILSKR